GGGSLDNRRDDGVLHVTAVQRMGVTDDQAGLRGGRTRQERLELHSVCGSQGHTLFGYHLRERIRRGTSSVQWLCCPVTSRDGGSARTWTVPLHLPQPRRWKSTSRNAHGAPQRSTGFAGFKRGCMPSRITQSPTGAGSSRGSCAASKMPGTA